MNTRITCPGCGRLLHLPEDCTAEMLSCPRCLAEIKNPQADDRFYPLQPEDPPRSPSVTSLPSAPARRMHSLPPVDWTVARDNHGLSCLMIVLAILGSLGVGYAFLVGSAVLRHGEDQPLFFILGVLSVLTFLSAGWVWVRKPSQTLGANIGRIVLGVLTISGVIVVVSGLLMLAALIVLFAVCLSSNGKC